jgi:hypothetical protein
MRMGTLATRDGVPVFLRSASKDVLRAMWASSAPSVREKRIRRRF